MLRSGAWWCAMALAASGVMMSGCAQEGPKPGGVKEVSPPTKSGAPTEAPKDAPAEDKKGDEKPTPPPPAGSTTGGGTETPSNGQ